MGGGGSGARTGAPIVDDATIARAEMYPMMPRRPDAAATRRGGVPGVPRVSAGGRGFRRAPACAGRTGSETNSEAGAGLGAEVGAEGAL